MLGGRPARSPGQREDRHEADREAGGVGCECPAGAKAGDDESADDRSDDDRGLRAHVDDRVALLELVVGDHGRQDRLARGHEERVDDAEHDRDAVDLPQLHVAAQDQNRERRDNEGTQAHRAEHRDAR